MTAARPAFDRRVFARGYSRDDAAAYVGVSPVKFDELVRDGRMPKARRIDGRKLWDRLELDAAFDALPHDGEDEVNEWLSGNAA